MIKFLFPFGQSPRQAGFGLVELLVSISIMVLVTGTVIARHSAFNGASLLRSQAWELALAVREVQLTAVSASNVGGDFRQVYGVHFDISAGGDNQGFAVFKDENGDNFYTAGSDDLVGKQGRLDRRFEIAAIRAYNVGAPLPDPSVVSITFERPNYDVRHFMSGVGVEINADRLEIVIQVRGEPTNRRTVEITKTGQITVQNNS